MYELRQVFELDEVRSLLETTGLHLSEKPDYTVGLYGGNALVATGSLLGNVVLGLAVDPLSRGEGHLATVMGCLIEQAALRGHTHLFLYTKPGNRVQIETLGFRCIGVAGEYAVLFEFGIPDLHMYLQSLKEQWGTPDGVRGAIVMNANPPTNGHLSLIKRASAYCDELFVFVVEADRSLFSFQERISTLREAVGESRKIHILPSGPYMISSATFPDYFLKNNEHARGQAMLDVDIFCRWIAPEMGITVRFVGKEPFCALTNLYNEVMIEQLPKNGIELVCFERKMYQKKPISASGIRALYQEGRLEEIMPLVPEATWRLLNQQKLSCDS